MLKQKTTTSLPHQHSDQHSDEHADEPADGALANSLAQEMVGLFKLLADETRLRILYYLVHEPELNVRALCHRLQQSQPAVSHHLALMRSDGLIECRRDGKHNFYYLVPDRMESFVELIFRSLPHAPDRIRLPHSELRLERK